MESRFISSTPLPLTLSTVPPVWLIAITLAIVCRGSFVTATGLDANFIQKKAVKLGLVFFEIF